MFLKNGKARLITADIKGKKYKFIPAGVSVEVPDDARKASPFIDALMKDGSLFETGGDDADKKAKEKQAEKDAESLKTDKDDKKQLKDYALSIGVKITGNWGADKIASAIEERKDEIHAIATEMELEIGDEPDYVELAKAIKSDSE